MLARKNSTAIGSALPMSGRFKKRKHFLRESAKIEMSTVREGHLRDLPHPSLNDVLKANTYSAIKLLKTVGEFAHKVAALKEQTGNQLLSVVESFRKRNLEMKKDRAALSSALSCWEILLGEYEKEAQDMLKISSNLVRQVSTPLFDEVVKKKAVTKKMFSFRENSETQIEKAEEVLQKCHKEYSEACAKLTKLQNTGAETGKQEHVQTLCQNTHNAYVLQLNNVNNLSNAFYSTTLPQLLDDLQVVQADVSASLTVAFCDCAQIEKDNRKQTFNNLQLLKKLFWEALHMRKIMATKTVQKVTNLIVDSVQRLESIESMFRLMDSKADIATFVQTNNPGIFTPPEKRFQRPDEGQSLNLVEGKLQLADVTEPVLKRKYIALLRKSRNLETSIRKDQEALKSLKQLQESYFKNPSYGNAGEIEEDLLRQKNELRTKEWECCVIKEQTKLFSSDILSRLRVTEDDLLDEDVGDEENITGTVDKRQSVHSSKGNKIRRVGHHQFEDQAFAKPKFCFYCKGLIKGIIRQGVRCKACKMSVHNKCRSNVPYCPGERSVAKAQSLHIQRSQEDDSDGPVYSDVDDTPTLPLHRKGLSPSSSLPAYNRSDDVYDTAETMLPSSETRFCVTLYDFAGENEGDLRLRAGEKVRVLNSGDENWWEGTSKGQTGFFPASYVQIISPGDMILRCLYDFNGQEGDELTIQANQIIVQVRNEGNGWIIGRTGSVEGALPASYVEEVADNGPGH